MKNNQHNGIENVREFDRLLSKARGVFLFPEEKHAIWNKIEQSMKTGTAPHRTWRVSTYTFIVEHQKSLFSVLTIALVVILGGGISAAAANALPGDLLYPVKVNVNERAQILFTPGVEAKAELEAVQASNRLAEAEQLAVQGKLTPEAQAEIQSNFAEHASNIEAHAQALRTSGDAYDAAAVSSDFEGALMAHKDILARISQSDDQGSLPLMSMNMAVNTTLDRTVALRTQTEADLATSSDMAVVKSAAEQADTAARDSLATAKKVLKQISASYASDATASGTPDDPDNQIQTAEGYQTAGISKLVSGAYGDALILFGKAHRTAEQASIESNVSERIGKTGGTTNAPSISNASNANKTRPGARGVKRPDNATAPVTTPTPPAIQTTPGYPTSTSSATSSATTTDDNGDASSTDPTSRNSSNDQSNTDQTAAVINARTHGNSGKNKH